MFLGVPWCFYILPLPVIMVISNKRWKGVLQKVDHAAIFILIAGTYTPFLLVALYEYVDISFIIIMWVIALVRYHL
jgi:hemolysin III